MSVSDSVLVEMKRKLSAVNHSMEHWNWNLIHEINQSMELEQWKWNGIGTNKQLVLVKDSQALISHTEKKLWLLVHFYILFLKLCKKKYVINLRGCFNFKFNINIMNVMY